MHQSKGAAKWAAAVVVLFAWDEGIAQQSADQNASDQPVQEVVVTGIRASLEAAQEIKKDAPSVVEAITLEDLGKFTDTNVTDALQRLPGVNIDRNPLPQSGGGDSVAIRGLGADYSSTTINGRDALGTSTFFGQGARHFDFASVPPEIIAAITVYKTSTSELIEPGMAGQVDMRTLRPLDYDAKSGNYFGSFTAAGSKYDGDSRVGPRLSGILGGKFFDGTVGAYVTLLDSTDYEHLAQFTDYTNQYNLGVQNSNGSVTQYNNVWAVWGTDSWEPDLKTEKFATSGGLQIKPNENLDIMFDALYNHYSIGEQAQADYFQSSGIFLLSPTTIAAPGSAVIGGHAVPGVTDGGLVTYNSAEISNIIAPGSTNSGALSYDAPFNDQNDYHYFVSGVNAVWKSDDDRLRISGDIAHSDNDYFAHWRRSYLQNGIGGEVGYNGEGEYPQWAFSNSPATDVTNPSSYTSYGFVENFEKENRGNRNSYRGDISYRLLDGLVDKLGVNYQVTSTRFISMNFDPTTFPTVVPSNYFVPGTTALIAWPVGTPNTSFANFCAANPKFCYQTNQNFGSFAFGFPGSSGTPGGSGTPFVPATPGDVFDLNTTESYKLDEQNTALYDQLDFKGDVGGLKYSGNVGLRAVHEEVEGTAFQGVVTTVGYTSGGVLSSVVAPVTEKNSYWEYLPSVNFNLNPLQNLAVRLGFSKTISLASAQQLAPLGNVDIVLPTASGIAQPSQATTNNIDLKPTQARNYDLTVEYYTSYGGAYIGSVFYKQVEDLITNVVLNNQILPGQGSRLFVLNSVINGADGSVKGFEIGTNQPLTFLPSPWNGFGIQGNFTYVDTSTNVNGFPTQFIGSSKDNLNINAYFDKYGFEARIAYLYRSSYVNDFANGVDIATPQTQIDASLSMKFTNHFEVILTGSNLTGQNLAFYSQQGGFLNTFAQRPKSFTLALRGNL
jgi:iron complex outermembrane receptor protein